MKSASLQPSGFTISVCGQPAPELASELQRRLEARVASGHLKRETLHDVENASFRPIPAGMELEAEAVERLRRLAQLWDVHLRPLAISSHRPVIGPVIVFVKRILFSVLRLLLKDTLHQQRSFNAEVIRALAELSSKPKS
jgi:hypothetical protein